MTRDRILQLLERLEALNIIRHKEGLYELKHDILARKITEKWSAEEKILNDYSKIVINTYSLDNLLTEKQVLLIKDIKDRLKFNESDKEKYLKFIDHCDLFYEEQNAEKDRKLKQETALKQEALEAKEKAVTANEKLLKVNRRYRKSLVKTWIAFVIAFAGVIAALFFFMFLQRKKVELLVWHSNDYYERALYKDAYKNLLEADSTFKPWPIGNDSINRQIETMIENRIYTIHEIRSTSMAKGDTISHTLCEGLTATFVLNKPLFSRTFSGYTGYASTDTSERNYTLAIKGPRAGLTEYRLTNTSISWNKKAQSIIYLKGDSIIICQPGNPGMQRKSLAMPAGHRNHQSLFSYDSAGETCFIQIRDTLQKSTFLCVVRLGTPEKSRILKTIDDIDSTFHLFDAASKLAHTDSAKRSIVIYDFSKENPSSITRILKKNLKGILWSNRFNVLFAQQMDGIMYAFNLNGKTLIDTILNTDTSNFLNKCLPARNILLAVEPVNHGRYTIYLNSGSAILYDVRKSDKHLSPIDFNWKEYSLHLSPDNKISIITPREQGMPAMKYEKKAIVIPATNGLNADGHYDCTIFDDYLILIKHKHFEEKSSDYLFVYRIQKSNRPDAPVQLQLENEIQIPDKFAMIDSGPESNEGILEVRERRWQKLYFPLDKYCFNRRRYLDTTSILR